MNTKRILGILLSAVMLLSCFSLAASAVDTQAINDYQTINLNYVLPKSYITSGYQATVWYDNTQSNYGGKLPTPTASGYVFIGWTTTALEPSEVLSYDPATGEFTFEGDLIVYETPVEANTATIYAVWIENVYKINAYYFGDFKDGSYIETRQNTISTELIFQYDLGPYDTFSHPEHPTAAEGKKVFAGWIIKGQNNIINGTEGRVTSTYSNIAKLAGLSLATPMKKLNEATETSVSAAGKFFEPFVIDIYAKWYDASIGTLEDLHYDLRYGSSQKIIFDSTTAAPKDYGPIVWSNKTELDNGLITISNSDNVIRTVKTPFKLLKAGGPVQYVGYAQADGASIEVNVKVHVDWWQWLILIPLLGFIWY